MAIFTELQRRDHEQMAFCSDRESGLQAIIAIAKQEKIPTYLASNKLAEERINRIAPIKQIYASKSEFIGRMGEIDRVRRR